MSREDDPPDGLFAAKREPRLDSGTKDVERPRARLAWSTNIEFFMTPQTPDGNGIKCIRCHNSPYADLVKILESTTHHAFPVVDDDTCSYQGIISRSQLSVILMTACLPTPPLHQARSENEQKDWQSIAQPTPLKLQVGAADTRDFFPHFPCVGDLPPVSAFGENAVVDIGPYVNRSAPSVSPDTNARFVWRLFRTTRMRHVVVVDENRHVVGIVTRSDLIKSTHHGTQPRHQSCEEDIAPRDHMSSTMDNNFPNPGIGMPSIRQTGTFV